ncbi:ATP synthase F1, epsilon subunit [Catenulispora acidiphila DSM 44928]|uniref:ATP synthase epsilon chain n=1 Tax=Catenulispora acidiphila (strain DSM 44928 / JCM 14897 / NBRC 102108 / NRRL B-24433 / ID139908) TaxID=479433 RepID=C7Q756_CATAD|nr:F0F1 ATP synthase subunit epsilon [Catenulispora acidiphila]ACU70144.1 ATP synthase F1, epsilon subunit [Catenulispora acidiphila DSM 44928]
MSESHAASRRLNVSLVAADRKVWQGTAEMVIARTTEGDTGVLPGHQPILSILAPSVVSVRGTEEGLREVVVSGGFLSVARDDVSILAESILLPEEIDVAGARELAAQARAAEDAAGEDSAAREQAQADLRFAEAQLRVSGDASVGAGTAH